jgi:ABC-type multidrug transport system fused ATPase/permease subunit
VLVSIVALTNLVSASSLFRRLRPRWTKPFIEDPAPRAERDRKDGASIFWAVSLAAISIVAVIAQTVKVINFPDLLVHAVFQLSSWILVALVLALTRPRSSPVGLMAFYIGSTVVESAGLGYDTVTGIGISAVAPNPRTATHQLVLILSVASALILLAMPMHVESRDYSPIAKVGAAPSNAERTPEEALRLWQYLTVSWVSPLLRIGNARQLEREDLWRLPYTVQSRRLADAFRDVPGSSIFWRLVKANLLDSIVLVIASFIDVLCSKCLATLRRKTNGAIASASPILLHQLLVIMESPNRNGRAALVYATLTFAVRITDTQNAMLMVWFERRCYERARAEIIMMVYEKVLRRKVIVSKDQTQDSAEPGASNGAANGHGANGAANGSSGANGSADKKPRGRFAAKWDLVKQLFASQAATKTKGPASTGQVLNMVRSDAYDLAQRFSQIKPFVNTPVGLIFTIYLIWWLLGPSCFLAVAIFVVGHIINILLARVQVKWRRTLQKATDARIQQSSQFIESLRNLRWYGWQEKWLDKVMAARRQELNTRIISLGLMLTTYFTSVFTSNTFPVVAFFAYTVLGGHELRIDLIFPAIELFGDLQMHMRNIPDLITMYLNALVSIERVDSFLKEEELASIASADQPSDLASTRGRQAEVPPVLKLDDCSFAWPGTTEPVLRNVTLTVGPGLTLVCGKIGSGKSALLQSFLGELDLLGGTVDLPNECVGYCSQTPWLQGVSIRDNILFHTLYDEKRYQAVLDACALLPDLASFKDGDQSHIGEK